MAVYTETKTYHTKAHMGMIDVTEDFHHAVEEAARQKNIRNGTCSVIFGIFLNRIGFAF